MKSSESAELSPMATLVSPVPVASYRSAYADAHRPSYRLPLRTGGFRSYQSRKSMEAVELANNVTRPPVNDSSDDEDLVPIKLSAEAQAILGEDNSRAELDQEHVLPNVIDDKDANEYQENRKQRQWANQRHSPTADHGSPAPRSMRAHRTRVSPPRTLARDGSFMYKIQEKSIPRDSLQDSKTPAPAVRRIRVSGSRNQTKSPPSSSKSGSAVTNEQPAIEASIEAEGKTNDDMDVGDEGDHGLAHPSTILRSRRNEEGGIHSTMRVRRIGTGALLNGPIRRGMIRRQSDDDNEKLYRQESAGPESPEIEQSRRAKEPELEDLPDQAPISHDSPNRLKDSQLWDANLAIEPKQASPEHVHISYQQPSPVRRNALSTSISRTKPTPASNGSHLSSKSSSSNRKPVFKIPSLPPLESAHDQENEPPPTFKRNKASAALLEIHEDLRSASPEPKSKLPVKEQQPSLHESPSRPPLVARSNNTPHRHAPAPPPKMSLIDAATSAGANSRSKKSVYYVLNGRTYRRLDCVGRGGSSRVFRVMAENYRIFALKRVNLDEADMAAIAGYKGEIDLLRKLENVDRVVRLFDYEVNEEKGVLSVMMELGESDFNKMLNQQLKGENARLDVTFTRHYWKEMLECVKAVHNHDIVHSDLKPANFLLVNGQLKLIDFGIAGAIQDNTVNVHRENQAGTLNYMSPESLICHSATGQANGTKIQKLGKPGDVWSLGCILYQMTYGQPPFAHITKQYERMVSIPNPQVEIQFPGTGIGGAVVPFGLIKTLRRCLQRDQTLRPTIADLLSDSDPFLNPVAISPDMLGRVIGNVIGYCRKREDKLKEEGRLQMENGLSVLPKDEEMRGWPGAFYEKLKEAGREGTAW